jgi:hypothetical protein
VIDEGTQPISEDLFEGRSVYVAACDGLTTDRINFTNRDITTAVYRTFRNCEHPERPVMW